MNHELITQRFAVQREAHGAQSLRQYCEYGEGLSTAQQSDVHKEWVGEMACVG
jgi:hypothetical protein